jgi:hypothetical protein
MLETVEILCLANSRKHNGRCVAGLRTDGGGWIRPVGKNDLKVLMERHYQYGDGDEAMPLDLIRLAVDTPLPVPHHPEDWQIAGKRWELLARPAPPDLAVPLLREHLERGPELLGCTRAAVPVAEFCQRPAAASLTLVWAKNLCWSISRVGEYQRRRTRVKFTVSGRNGAADYDLALTDPEWEHRLSSLPVGDHPQEAAPGIAATDRVLLTVSLSEPLGGQPVRNEDGLCYKLAAAVIVVPPDWRRKQAKPD